MRGLVPERPIDFLSVDFLHCAKDALPVFVDSIPRIRLEHLWCYEIEQDDVYKLCDQMHRCESVKVFRIHAREASNHQWNDGMMEAITRVFQQMPSLEDFYWGVVEVHESLTKENMLTLAGLVTSRPSLKRFAIMVLAFFPVGLATVFFKACGFHPRLRDVVLSVYRDDAFARIHDQYVRVAQSLCAQCLVVLVAGATLKRVGEHSTLWHVSTDVLRKLLPFLDRTTMVMAPK